MDLTVPADNALRFVGGSTLIAALVAAAAFRYFYVQAQWQRGVQAARARAGRRAAGADPPALPLQLHEHHRQPGPRPIRRTPSARSRISAELFRATLRGGEGDSTLAAEIELVEHYLAIERLRLGERLRVEWRIDGLPRELAVPAAAAAAAGRERGPARHRPLAEGGSILIGAGRWPAACASRCAIRGRRSRRRLARGNRSAIENIRQRLVLPLRRPGGWNWSAGCWLLCGNPHDAAP